MNALTDDRCAGCTWTGDVVHTYCVACAASVAAMIDLLSNGTTSTIRVHHPHVEARPDVYAGSPIVRGTKVPVRRLWLWHRKGVSVETLVKRYPALGAAKVLDALSFAYDNQALIEADVERERDILDAECSKQPPLPKTRPNRRAPLTGARTEQFPRPTSVPTSGNASGDGK